MPWHFELWQFLQKLSWRLFAEKSFFFHFLSEAAFWNNRGASPWHVHPQGDDRCMDRSEGQLLKLVSFVLTWRWHVGFLLKVHFQVGDVADPWPSLDQSGLIQRYNQDMCQYFKLQDTISGIIVSLDFTFENGHVQRSKMNRMTKTQHGYVWSGWCCNECLHNDLPIYKIFN